jgi:uncharacterized protein YndB with AHSA1/START domain
MADQTFVYTIFIESTPERVWQALTDGAFTRRYWAGRRIESEWKEGATVRLYLEDSQDFELHGEVLDNDPSRRLSYTWRRQGAPVEEVSTVTFELHPMGDSVRLTVTHAPLAADDMARQGWAAILSSLKSYLETGKPISATEMWRRRAA